MKNISDDFKREYQLGKEKILQFGEGNFLRAFVDYMVHLANKQGLYDGSIVVCQPIEEGLGDMINQQDDIYTLIMRGMENGTPVEKTEIITSISRCIQPKRDFKELIEIAKNPDLEIVVSNTTEAGIAYRDGDLPIDEPPTSFPAKVTLFLYERFKAFNGDKNKGLLFLPVELIDDNGTELRKFVLQYANEWNLGETFINWIDEANEFANTLVDRIVTGYPKNEVEVFENKLGYKDNVMVTSEIFNLWVIEANKKWAEKFPIDKTEANVIWTDDVKSYKKRKVRILNGGHTATVLAGYLAGHNIVLDFMEDENFSTYLKDLIYDEIICTIDLPEEELSSFGNSVIERFKNPFIKHNLLDIALNSASKFNARCMPSLLDYMVTNKAVPKRLSFALASFIKFYDIKKEENGYFGVRKNGDKYQVKDDIEVLEFFEKLWKENSVSEEIVIKVLKNTSLWSDKDLSMNAGLLEKTAEYLERLMTEDIINIVKDINERG